MSVMHNSWFSKRKFLANQICMFEFISGIVAILEVCVCVCMCACMRVHVTMCVCVAWVCGCVLITFYAIERHVACQTSPTLVIGVPSVQLYSVLLEFRIL